MGSVTVYVYQQDRDECGSQGGPYNCKVNGVVVTCPPLDWAQDWLDLGEVW